MKNTLRQEFKVPLSEVDRAYIRKPVSIFLSICLIPFCIIFGAVEGLEKLYNDFFLKCYNGKNQKS